MYAIIDADSLVYEAAFTAQVSIEWVPGEPQVAADLEEAQEHFDAAITSILAATGATDYTVCLSCSRREENFRRQLFPEYKANRKAGNRPLLLGAMNEWVQNTYGALVKRGIEADDTVGILATVTDPVGFELPPVEERIIVAIDKDLETVPGLHYSWAKPQEGIVDVSIESADYWHLFQTLTGDSTDNYPGIRGVGPKKAERILEEDPTWETVLAAYEERGYDEEFALTQARLARILRASDYDFVNSEPILWRP